MKDNVKDWIRFISGIVCLICGIILSFISLYLPPTGVIDTSVIILIGNVMVFVGSLWGLHDFTKLQMKKLEMKTNEKLQP